MTAPAHTSEREALAEKAVVSVLEAWSCEPGRYNRTQQSFRMAAAVSAVLELVEQVAASEPPAQTVPDGWQTIDSAPRDGTVVWVYAPAYQGLRSIVCLCAWNEDAGWCVDELRQVTMWQPMAIPAPPAAKGEG